MPHSLTMLVRGLTTIEGVIAEIAPDINVVQVASVRMSGNKLSDFDLKKELRMSGKEIWQALQKGIKIPSYISDLLRSYMQGQTSINLDLHATDDLTVMLNALVRRLVMGIFDHGASDQFQYYLHHRYETEITWNSGTGSHRLFSGDSVYRVRVYQSFSVKKEKTIEKEVHKVWQQKRKNQ